MEITTERLGPYTEVRATGRLDGHWADHLTRALDEVLRQGAESVCLRMEGIDYISSLGIRVLMGAHRRFAAVRGTFFVAGAEGNVLKVLELAGIAKLLLRALPEGGAPAAAGTAAASPPQSAAPGPAREYLRDGARFTEQSLPGTGMTVEAFGQPDRPRAAAWEAADCRTVPVASDVVSLGLGAFGNAFESSRHAFGEYVAAGGAAACQPANGSNSCDTLVVQAQFVPELLALHGLNCRGSFTRLLRFDAADEAEPATLSALALAALDAAGADAACLVIAGESAGLVGATLRRSTAAAAAGTDMLAFPDVRDWLSFTGEPVHQRKSVFVAGVVARSAQVDPSLAAQLRPVGAEGGPEGHLHAAVFHYRPLQRGLLDVAGTVQPWFDQDTPEALLHLLADDREGGRLVESRLMRGACWVAPLAARGGSR